MKKIYLLLNNKKDLLAYILIIALLSIPSLPLLLSGDMITTGDRTDFFQYMGRHEVFRKSVIEYGTFPFYSFWIGGGYPNIAEPEDPSLNPLVILTLIFGSVKGIKLIGFISILLSGLSTYAFTRKILGYSVTGSLFSSFIYGLSLFIPIRLQDGNPNEIYSSFLPLCLLLLGLAYRGNKKALIILPIVFYTMLTDGKMNFGMTVLYIGLICALELIPMFSVFKFNNAIKVDIRPLKLFLLTLSISVLIGMFRILPVMELIHDIGGLKEVCNYFYKSVYTPETVGAYEFMVFLKQLVIWKDEYGLVTVGYVPVILSAVSIFIFRKQMLPWAIALLIFIWLILAHNAPFDLLKLLRDLPIFNTIYNPYKYYSFQIVFSFAIIAGKSFSLLSKIKSCYLRNIISSIIIIIAVSQLLPKLYDIQKSAYRFDISTVNVSNHASFYQVKGIGIDRDRNKPDKSVTYFNVLRNLGTIDWNTCLPFGEYALPKYFVDKNNNYLLNPAYKGEAYFLNKENRILNTEFTPNSIVVQVSVKSSDNLIINQNYHRNWSWRQGEILSRGGLLALNVVERGNYKIFINYTPHSFYIGLLLSSITILVILTVIIFYNKCYLQQWTKSSYKIVSCTSKIIIFLIS